MPNRSIHSQMNLRSKFILLAFDAFAALTIACVALHTFARPAYAYVDPSVMTYTIQALAGVAVALSTVLGVAFRKTRKRLLKAMGVDENAGKEVDAAWHRIDENGNVVAETAEEISAQSETGRKAPLKKDAEGKGNRPTWLRRFVLSLLAVGFAGFTLGIVAPFEIVAGSESSLTFSLTDVAPTMALFVAALVIVLALILSCIRGKAFTVLLALVFAVGLCCYIQAMFMNSGLPSANGSTVDFWGEHATMMVVSAIVWVLLMIGIPAISNINRSKSQAIIGLVCAALIVVQGVGVASLFMNTNDNGEENHPLYVTEDGMYEVSSKSNVIVFILDCFDTTVMNEILAEDSSVAEGLEDFTYYDNQAGTMIPTLYAVPNLLTGEVPQVGESIADYEDNRYKEGTFLQDISDAGYSIGLYSDTLMLSEMSNADSYENVARYTENIHDLNSFSIDAKGTLSALVKCALYRDAPWILKWRFWFYTDEVNQKVVKSDPEGSASNTIYASDDVRYYENLKNEKLSIAEDSSSYKGAFKFIHLVGDHSPYNIDENGNYVGMNGSTENRQAKGSLTMVKTYLQYLKDLGKYDDATIIITSDHGHWTSSLEQPTKTVSPILLVKKSGETDASSMSVSHSPVSHSDFQGTILSVIGASDEKYTTTYFDEFSEDRARDFYMITSDGRYAIDIYRYEIEGSVTNMDDWNLTNDSWHVNDPS